MAKSTTAAVRDGILAAVAILLVVALFVFMGLNVADYAGTP